MKNNIFTNEFFKIIAVITMIIDHFGYYYYPYIDNNIYLICRIIGRFSMPVFLYFIVYGYFKTSNFKKYLVRIFSLALITQISTFIIHIINNLYVKSYVINIYKLLNILFNFTILLITMKLIDNFKNNKFLSILGITINLILLSLFEIDYGFIILFLGLIYYFSFKFKISKYVYIPIFIFLSIMLSYTTNYLYIFMIIPILLLTLHNGKKGKNNYLFYIIFPIHHIILYGSVLVYNLLLRI